MLTSPKPIKFLSTNDIDQNSKQSNPKLKPISKKNYPHHIYSNLKFTCNQQYDNVKTKKLTQKIKNFLISSNISHEN